MSLTSTAPLSWSHLRDEALVLLAQEQRSDLAQTTLLERHRLWLHDLVARRAFPNEAREDARQEALVAFVAAVRTYRPHVEGGQPDCSFRTFLHAVVTKRLAKFARKCRREQRVFNGFAGAEASGQAEDPALLLPQAEQRDRLRQAINTLPEQDRRLCEMIAAGCPVGQIAAELGIDRKTVGLRRRRVGDCLRRQLREARDPDSPTANHSPEHEWQPEGCRTQSDNNFLSN